MKKTKLNIALADIMHGARCGGLDGGIVAQGRWHADSSQTQNLLKIDMSASTSGRLAGRRTMRKEHHDEFIMAGLAERLRDFGRTAASRMQEEQASSFAHLAVQAANAGYAMQSTISLKELGQLALKCHELKQRAPIIELSHHDFFKLSAEHWPWFDIDRANAIAGDAGFYYDGAFFKMNLDLLPGQAKVIENER